MRTFLTFLVVALLALAGCSSDDSGSGGDDAGSAQPSEAAIAAYIAEITPTFPAGATIDEDRWVQNGLIVCRFDDATLAKIRLEDLELDNNRTVRTQAAVRNFCPERLGVIEDPGAFAGE